MPRSRRRETPDGRSGRPAGPRPGAHRAQAGLPGRAPCGASASPRAGERRSSSSARRGRAVRPVPGGRPAGDRRGRRDRRGPGRHAAPGRSGPGRDHRHVREGFARPAVGRSTPWPAASWPTAVSPRAVRPTGSSRIRAGTGPRASSSGLSNRERGDAGTSAPPGLDYDVFSIPVGRGTSRSERGTPPPGGAHRPTSAGRRFTLASPVRRQSEITVRAAKVARTTGCSPASRRSAARRAGCARSPARALPRAVQDFCCLLRETGAGAGTGAAGDSVTGSGRGVCAARVTSPTTSTTSGP